MLILSVFFFVQASFFGRGKQHSSCGNYTINEVKVWKLEKNVAKLVYIPLGCGHKLSFFFKSTKGASSCLIIQTNQRNNQNQHKEQQK